MAIQPAAALAVLPALLLTIFVVGGAITTLPDFFDPCHEWGMEGGESEVELDDDCPSRSGSSRTRGEAAFGLIAIPGVLLLAAVCIVRGVLRDDRAWTGAGGTLVAVMVPPFGLGMFWIVALVAAALVFVGAAQLPVTVRAPEDRERVVASVTAALGVGLVTTLLATTNAYSMAALVVLIGVGGLLATVMLDRQAATPSEE